MHLLAGALRKCILPSKSDETASEVLETGKILQDLWGMGGSVKSIGDRWRRDSALLLVTCLLSLQFLSSRPTREAARFD